MMSLRRIEDEDQREDRQSRCEETTGVLVTESGLVEGQQYQRLLTSCETFICLHSHITVNFPSHV